MDNSFEKSSETRVDIGALDQSASNSRKLYIWWWKYVMYPLYAAELVSVMLPRLYVAADFPHQCLICDLLGAFLAPALCIYVSDPFIWKYGYHASYHTSCAVACHVLNTLATAAAVIAGLSYWCLKLCGWDQHWTIKRTFHWCENPESISVSTPSMSALLVSTGSLLGRALFVTPTVAETPPMVPEEEVVMLDNEYYDMSGEKILIILNQRKFMRTRYFNRKKPPSRNSTNEDRNKLKKLYEQLGYAVIVIHDHQYHSIIQKLTTIAARDHTRTSCICVAILTHGDQGGQICAADRRYLLSEVTNIFANVTSLVGKPKIYFVQACRGKNRDAGQTVRVCRQSNGVLAKLSSRKPSSRDSLETDADSTDRFDSQSEGVLTVPSHADSLVLYACAEDHVSLRNSNGSWMIQALCKQIEAFHKNQDLLHIINRVHNEVSRKTTGNNKKQMPETRYTLTKNFKF